MSDEELAQKAQEGDTEAFGELIGRYQDKLMRYARKFLLDPEDAQDIVQDIFIKAYENLRSFDATRRFSPWVYRIAHNEFINEIKKRQSRKTTFTMDFDTLFPHLQAAERADTAALERDTREMLEKHLEKVDPKYREPLILYYIEGMDYREIAEIMHLPTSTVGVRLARARTILQKIAKENLYE